MPILDPEKRSECRKRWYSKNKKSVINHVKERKLKIRKWLEEYKEGLKCSRCSENHPATIDFHHKNKSKKEQEISYLAWFGYSIKRIKREIEKCEILCANCHRKAHYKNNKL
ncbi:MAG: hypothetical protein MUF61_00560 [archaeon]|nr:hypothetical protein [archaeon]